MSGAWRRAVRPALGIGLLLIVLASVSPGEVLTRLFEARLSLVIPAIIGLTAIHALAAAGWRAMLATVAGIRLPWRTAVSVYYAAQAIGGITPANLGGDIHRVVSLRGSGYGWSVAVAPVIIQRATSYLALSALSLGGLAVLVSATEVAIEAVLIGLAFAGLVALAAWTLLAPPRPLRRVHARLVTLAVGAAPSRAIPMSRLRTASLIGLGQGIAFHAGSIGLTWLLVLSVDPGVPDLHVLAALAVARLAMAVPISPSGLGVQEGALALLFAALGLAPDTALAAMLLARVSLLLTTGIGTLLLLHARPVPRPETRMMT